MPVLLLMLLIHDHDVGTGSGTPLRWCGRFRLKWSVLEGINAAVVGRKGRPWVRYTRHGRCGRESRRATGRGLDQQMLTWQDLQARRRSQR